SGSFRTKYLLRALLNLGRWVESMLRRLAPDRLPTGAHIARIDGAVELLIGVRVVTSGPARRPSQEELQSFCIPIWADCSLDCVRHLHPKVPVRYLLVGDARDRLRKSATIRSA